MFTSQRFKKYCLRKENSHEIDNKQYTMFEEKKRCSPKENSFSSLISKLYYTKKITNVYNCTLSF